MTEVYLIRHTQAEGNCYRMMQGFWDGAVTPLGFREIEALGQRFESIPVDAVYASDLTRARETAGGIARRKDLPVYTDPRLRELDMGPWEMQFFGNLAHDDPETVHLFLRAPGSWHVEGAETVYDVIERAYPALCEIAEKHDGGSVAVVSHGMTIRCLLTRILGIGFSEPELLPICKNTAVNRLTYENGTFTLDYFNDASHIEPLVIGEWNSLRAMRDEVFDPAEDPAFYSSCYGEAWAAAHRGSLEGFDSGYYYQAALRHHAENPDSVRKLFLDDVCVGLIDCDTARGRYAGYGWVSLLYLMPEYRGKGYGVQALGRALALYTGLRRSSLRLYVAAANKAARRFYEKHDFSILGSEPGAREPLYLMEKRIGGSSCVW